MKISICIGYVDCEPIFVEPQLPVDANGNFIVEEVIGYTDDGKPLYCATEPEA